jgi:hypothetical protein
LLDELKRERGKEVMRPKTRYGRRRGEGVKTSLRVAIKHGWKSSMNITPWDYLDRELIRFCAQKRAPRSAAAEFSAHRG